MSTHHEIEYKITEDWGSDSCAMLLFSRLLGDIQPGATRYFPLHYLANLVKDRYDLKEVEDAARYFAGERLGLFELAFELIEHDNESRDIDTAAVLKALQTGVLLDPDTGSEIKDFDSKIFMYFRGTDLLHTIVTAKQ